MAFTNEEPFDLSKFLPDSLCLESNTMHPTKHMFHRKMDNYYMDFAHHDPREVLGERDFNERKEEPEHIVGSPIEEFFRGANVFITGGTGFLGKVLTEKLIRSMPLIGQIYLLIRAKKGKSSKERFEKLLEDKLFARMRAEVPNYFSKLTIVDGDISQPDLGLSNADRQMLQDRIHVIFHSAADVRFIEPLRAAVKSNVLGSKRVLDLGQEMKNLRSYVHVSTAYSQCIRRVVKEIIPKLSIDYKEILRYIETKTDEDLKEETPRILQGWPNTYTFSKALCEDMIQEEAKDLPLCVFRPSVVLPTYREPVRGWTDNLYGPTGLLVGTGHGILHCARMDSDLGVDMVPVDYVVNCMIAAAWRTADNKCGSTDSIKVYNFTYTALKPTICWKTIGAFAISFRDIWPYKRSIWYTSFFYTRSAYLNDVFFYLLHKVPGFCIDKVAELIGATAGLSKIYQTIENLREQTDYFSLRIWEFKSDNVMELWNTLSEKDKKTFYFDVRDVDLREQFMVSKLGIKHYYLKEKLEDIPACERKNTWLYWAHISLKLAFSVAVLKLLVLTARCIPL